MGPVGDFLETNQIPSIHPSRIFSLGINALRSRTSPLFSVTRCSKPGGGERYVQPVAIGRICCGCSSWGCFEDWGAGRSTVGGLWKNDGDVVFWSKGKLWTPKFGNKKNTHTFFPWFRKFLLLCFFGGMWCEIVWKLVGICSWILNSKKSQTNTNWRFQQNHPHLIQEGFS